MLLRRRAEPQEICVAIGVAIGLSGDREIIMNGTRGIFFNVGLHLCTNNGATNIA